MFQDVGYLPKGGERDGRGLCPYDPNHNSTVTFVGEYPIISPSTFISPPTQCPRPPVTDGRPGSGVTPSPVRPHRAVTAVSIPVRR